MVEMSLLPAPAPPPSAPSQTSTTFKGSFTDHLANERTFLAWIRTGLGIFAFGCAVARFGGSDHVQISSKSSFHEMKSVLSGLILISCGIITQFYSIYRYHRINQQIMHKDLTEVSRVREPIIATLVLLLSMIALLIIFVLL
jgi:putative membrane protein